MENFYTSVCCSNKGPGAIIMEITVCYDSLLLSLRFNEQLKTCVMVTLKLIVESFQESIFLNLIWYFCFKDL